MFVSLILRQAPCQKARLTREKCSSPREHCGNTDAGGVCQVIAEQPPMVSRLSFGDAVAIKSKPRALIWRVAPYVRDRLQGIGFDGLKSTRMTFLIFGSLFDRPAHHLTKSRAHADSMGTERPGCIDIAPLDLEMPV